MKKVVFALAALATVAATPSFAADLPAKTVVLAPQTSVVGYRWYIEGRLGIPLRQEYDINLAGVLPGQYEADTGWYAALAAGVQWHPNWRGELAFSYATGKDGTVTIAGFGIPHAGRVHIYTFGVNGYYVFTNFGPTFQPFVGAGVGVAVFDISNLGAVGGAFVADGTDTTIAAGLHLGADYYLTPRVALTGRYTLGYTGDVSVGSVPAGITITRDGSLDHIFSAGLRVYLN